MAADLPACADVGEASPAAYCGASLIQCRMAHKADIWAWPAELPAKPDVRDQRLTVGPEGMSIFQW